MTMRYGASRIAITGSTEHITYTPVRVPAKRSGKCPACGRRVTRSRTFESTVSPFNRDPETGYPRTYQQVRGVVAAAAVAWTPDFTHAACTDSSADRGPLATQDPEG